MSFSIEKPIFNSMYRLFVEEIEKECDVSVQEIVCNVWNVLWNALDSFCIQVIVCKSREKKTAVH